MTAWAMPVRARLAEELDLHHYPIGINSRSESLANAVSVRVVKHWGKKTLLVSDYRYFGEMDPDEVVVFSQLIVALCHYAAMYETTTVCFLFTPPVDIPEYHRDWQGREFHFLVEASI